MTVDQYALKNLYQKNFTVADYDFVYVVCKMKVTL